MGVRASTDGIQEVVRRALASHVLERPQAGANYSVQVAPAERGRTTPGFYFLLRNAVVVTRSRDLTRVVDALASHLSCHAVSPAPARLEVDAMAVVANGAALVLPPEVRHHLPVIERRLNSNGVRVVDTPFVVVDPSGPDVVVPEPVASVDRSVLDAWSAANPGVRRDPAVPSGRYRLRAWAFASEPAGGLPAARAVAYAGARLLNARQLGIQQGLEMLAETMRAVATVGIWADEPEDLVAPLVTLAS